jgi:hypothetical protein
MMQPVMELDAAEAERIGMVLELGGEALAQVLVSLEVEAFEQAFRAQGRQWLAPGAEARPGSRAAALASLLSGEARAPVVLFSQAGGELRGRFLDGRHRWCVLRDAGAKRVNVGMLRHWAKWCEEAGIGVVVG